MFILNVVKWIVLFGLVLTNTAQVFLCFRLKKYWERLPVVAVTITKSEIDHWNDADGSRHFDANIEFSYQFRGKEVVSDTPALRGPELFVPFSYNSDLVDRYKVGEIYNARVVPIEPYMAYLERAPFSRLSAIVLPLATLVYAAILFGYGAFFYFAFASFTE